MIRWTYGHKLDLDPKQFLTLITINLENVKEFLLDSSIPISEWVAESFSNK
jgi:hypothetical protein